MPSFSNCEIVGHAGQDCKVFAGAKGPIVNVSVALSVWDWHKKEKRTVWTEIRVFGKPAEWFRPQKGDLCHVSGAEYVVDEYEDNDGNMRQKHYFTAGMGSRVYSVPSSAFQEHRETQEPKTGELPMDAKTTKNDEELPF